MLDCETLLFQYINPAARKNLQYSEEELAGTSFLSLAPDHNREDCLQCLQTLKNKQAAVAYHTVHTRKDGTHYPIEFQLFWMSSAGSAVVIAIGTDVSSRDQSDLARLASEERLNAMVSNTPGLVYQSLLDQRQGFSFPYLSEGCEALLGVSAAKLQEDPALFIQLILPEDRASYREAMTDSLKTMNNWNWEGRIWIEKWKDIKWINMRATPRELDRHRVQWEGIMTNITASKMEQEEITRSRAQLAELTAHVDTVKEKERTRISREIHDDLGGNLTAIKMALAMLTRKLPDDATLTEKADYVEQLVDRTIETVHRIAGDLRPGILDFGLVAAIEWQAKEFEKQVGIPCTFHSDETDLDLDLDQATALFRIFQEALTNIAKHAKATLVNVQLMRTSTYVRLEITDNGIGIAASDHKKTKSFGIRGMVERSIALGGSLSVSTAPKGGTVVAIKAPLST